MYKDLFEQIRQEVYVLIAEARSLLSGGRSRARGRGWLGKDTKDNRNVWRSFQGCVIAGGPFAVAILTAYATYRFLQPFGLPPFVTAWATFIMGACVFMLAVILKNGLGE